MINGFSIRSAVIILVFAHGWAQHFEGEQSKFSREKNLAEGDLLRNDWDTDSKLSSESHPTTEGVVEGKESSFSGHLERNSTEDDPLRNDWDTNSKLSAKSSQSTDGVIEGEESSLLGNLGRNSTEGDLLRNDWDTDLKLSTVRNPTTEGVVVNYILSSTPAPLIQPYNSNIFSGSNPVNGVTNITLAGNKKNENEIPTQSGNEIIPSSIDPVFRSLSALKKKKNRNLSQYNFDAEDAIQEDKTSKIVDSHVANSSLKSRTPLPTYNRNMGKTNKLHDNKVTQSTNKITKLGDIGNMSSSNDPSLTSSSKLNKNNNLELSQNNLDTDGTNHKYRAKKKKSLKLLKNKKLNKNKFVNTDAESKRRKIGNTLGRRKNQILDQNVAISPFNISAPLPAHDRNISTTTEKVASSNVTNSKNNRRKEILRTEEKAKSSLNHGRLSDRKRKVSGTIETDSKKSPLDHKEQNRFFLYENELDDFLKLFINRGYRFNLGKNNNMITQNNDKKIHISSTEESLTLPDKNKKVEKESLKVFSSPRSSEPNYLGSLGKRIWPIGVEENEAVDQNFHFDDIDQSRILQPPELMNNYATEQEGYGMYYPEYFQQPSFEHENNFDLDSLPQRFPGLERQEGSTFDHSNNYPYFTYPLHTSVNRHISNPVYSRPDLNIQSDTENQDYFEPESRNIYNVPL